jgi:hypothetical protein
VLIWIKRGVRPIAFDRDESDRARAAPVRPFTRIIKPSLAQKMLPS